MGTRKKALQHRERDISLARRAIMRGLALASAAILPWSMLPRQAYAGDILRGGAAYGQPSRAVGSPAGAPSGPAADQARANANDALARTAQSLQAVRSMQAAARAAAAAKTNAGADPNNPGQMLPDVPDGLGPGGLQVQAGGVWTGANLPTQSGGGRGVLVNIKQTQQQAILNWTTFNVGSRTTVNFDQSAGGAAAGQWIAFNKVNDPSGVPSQILGSIQAQGQVYIINQNGIIFGAGSQVNVHTLVASSLPINENLITRGLLNNPDAQFLFSALAMPAGANGTPGFTPPPSNLPDGRIGDVTVQAGAVLSSPVSASGTGGRIVLVGPNVTNAGTIATPGGQTILAAGLQVGFAAHASSDPSLRGLDAFVGAVVDPASAIPPYAGTATNIGLIEAPRGNVTMTGKTVRQLGFINSSTSVALNGRIDLNASYDAVSNTAYKPAVRPDDVPFLYRRTGQVELGAGSVIQVLPEYADTSRVAGASLALKSQVNIRGLSVYLGKSSIILAPGGNVAISAGVWDFVQTQDRGINTFVRSAGQIYLDRDALINVAGTTDAQGVVSDWLLTVQLRGAEVAGSPLQRNSIFRRPDGTGASITVDLRRSGVFNGFRWVGTPLADLSGYVSLIQRTVSELTTAGGTVTLNAGSSVVMQPGSVIDVSGGWVNYDGTMVKTTRVLLDGHLFDIADAPPDRLYAGIYTGQTSFTHSRWGVTKTYAVPWMSGEHYEPAYFTGADGGSIQIAAGAMALDGTLRGHTFPGQRQERSGRFGSESDLPKSSELKLAFTAQQFLTGVHPVISPTPPEILFSNNGQAPADAFALDANEQPLELREDRRARVFLSPELLTSSGFGHLTVENPDGRVTVPAGTTLSGPPLGSVTLSGANVDVLGSIVVPGGKVQVTVFNISPTIAGEVLRDPNAVSPPPNEGRGHFTLGAGATISTAGLVIDDRLNASAPFSQPVVLDGGVVDIHAYAADLRKGSLIDVSGGVRMDPFGEPHYGNGGGIIIATGQDPGLGDVFGGTLRLDGALLGRSGAEGGSLSIQALLIQVGGAALHPKTTLIQPEFFSQGGFTDFTLTGLGLPGDTPGEFVPAVYIAPGTVIEPVAESYVAVPHPLGGGLGTMNVVKPVGLRSPVSLHFAAPGVSGKLGEVIRGDIVFGEGARISTDPLGEVSFRGNTVAILGSVFAPGGTITIEGATKSSSLLSPNLTEALISVYIGPRSTLSTAGTTVLLPDAFGRRTGYVLPGGTISIKGNIVAAAGSVMDVSGTSATLDFHPTAANPLLNYVVPPTSGLTTPRYSLMTTPVQVDSDGGTISLEGGEMLFVVSTLRGFAGGPTALGGTLLVSSGRFYEPNVIPPVTDSNLVVTQSSLPALAALPMDGSVIGQPVHGANGAPLISRGYFAADSFMRGGFDSLALGGVVEFQGPVTITARQALRIADGGILYANNDVRLTAPYVALGKDFVPPVPPELRAGQIPFTNVAPTYGPGRLIVTASLIDIGTLSLQNIGEALFDASGGDIRGNGILNIAGRVTLRAGQVYPTTLSDFSVIAYDYTVNGSTRPGTIRVEGGGLRSLPLSAGGTLSLYASVIEQFGTLRAPLGIINLGWDGSGTAPRDPITGNARPFPVTSSVTLGPGSITSVSAVDPITGQGIIVPYGFSDGTSWFDPRGVDITGIGLPSKAVNIAGGSVTMTAGATIDLRGGGDLMAVQWVIGNGGPADILGVPEGEWTANSSYVAGDLVSYHGHTYSARLSSQGIAPSISAYWTEMPTRYAVVPGYDFDYVPYSPFASFFNDSLHVGDRIFLGGSPYLAQGTYTLLPARYALLPGAVLVTPKQGIPLGTVPLPGGISLVSGYRFNSLNTSRRIPTLASRFEVAPANVVNARAEYRQFFADTFFPEAAERLNIPTPLLPKDSGYLLFQAAQGMSLQGTVLSPSISGGRGSWIDITAPLNFVIGDGSGGGGGTVALNTGVLNAFRAESLIIGGRRSETATGTTVTVLANNITVNKSGTPLMGPDSTLVSRGDLSIAPGATIISTGSLKDAPSYQITGNGTLVRVSQDLDVEITRTGVTPGLTPTLTIGEGALLSGGSLTLDSTGNTLLDPTAVLDAQVYTLNSGRISLQLDNPGALQPNPGLVLTGSLLKRVPSVSSLSLLSYSSIDIYGTGTLGGSLSRLSLNAGQIRGFHQGGGDVTVSTGALILGNKAAVAGAGLAAAATGDLRFQANAITFGANQLAIDQFSVVGFTAASSISGQGTGGISVQHDALLTTPLITGASGAIRTLAAGGALTATSIGGATGTAASLGSSLTLTGQNVSIDTAISLPSGTLAIRSSSGDLSIGGRLHVGGAAQTFYDVTRYTSAGRITLSSDAGDVVLGANSLVDVSGHPGGGDAGTLTVSAANGVFTAGGDLRGQAGAGGVNGSFNLDTSVLASTSALTAALDAARLTNSQTLRVRSGDVAVDGISRVHLFRLSADLGSITVTGTIDASGSTGGTIALASRGDLTITSGAVLDVSGQQFNSAGKGGSITLESGTQRNGAIGTGVVSIQAGSMLDLSVDAFVVGTAATVGSSAYDGKFTGTLHIRAPQTAGFNDVLVDPIDGTILNASSIVVEGYRLYDLTAANGDISSAVQTAIFNDAQSFLGVANAAPSANYTMMTNRLLVNNAGLAANFVLAPGAEIINRTGGLTLGSATSNTTADWNLSTYRFGAKGSPGVLTLRAAGDVTLFNALSDGFSPTLASSDPAWLWLARNTLQSSLLPINTQSWSYRITAGADLTSADFRDVLSGSGGAFKLGKDGGAMIASGGFNATTASVIGANLGGGGRGLFQVLRTGSGNIDIHAAGSVQLLNQFASIYTAGTRVADPTLGGTVDTISLSQFGGETTLGAQQQNFPAIFTVAGGNVVIIAGTDIERLGASSRELPNNWLYRRGYVNPDTGRFAQTGFSNAIASTAWWIDFSNFFQGVGTLGGGDVTLLAGRNVTNMDAVAPTNARTSKGTAGNPLAVNQVTLELGGGDLTVRAGSNIDGGVYYVERGQGILSAGGVITTNASRSPGKLDVGTGENAVIDPNSWLPTTLFLGKGGFDVSAGGDLLLGPVANPFLLPPGLGNSFWNKTYFSTYSPDSYVNVSSLGGKLTLREGSYVGNVFLPLLEAWAATQQLNNGSSSANEQPWLRLAETSVTPFRTAAALLPPTIRATAYSGDIHLVGNLTLSPSASGTVELLTRGGINGLQPVGYNTNLQTSTWVSSRINVSDANPAAIPGVRSPFAYQTVVGTSATAASATVADFLSNVDLLFAETGATLGTQAALQVKQLLHAPGLLHLQDPHPLRLYAGGADISGLTLFSPKPARLLAARDITDVALYLQNLDEDDDSIVGSGRDIIPYNPSSLLRIAANRAGNLPVEGFPLAGSGPLAGDIQINGPGALQVLAGRNLDLGTGPNNADGTGTGISSIGNARNPYLPFEGADLIVGAGIGPALSLFNSQLDFDGFISSILGGPEGQRYLSELAARDGDLSTITGVAQLQTLEDEKKAKIALDLFFIALRDAGRDQSLSGGAAGGYASGYAAIQSLFGNAAASGDIFTRERDIRTRSGGDISIFAPAGSLSLAQTVSRQSLIPPGIITEAGGNISIFTHGSVNLGVSRIFTLRGGDITIWSSTGDIAAGASSKTVQSAPPTRVLIDPTSADVSTDLAGLATGGGIGVLATVAGVPPGNVDLIAPLGVVDAGDAGIRATGNLTIAATAVLNASNISVGGSSTGTPAAPVVAAPNVGGLTAAASTAGASASAASATMKPTQPPQSTEDPPSIITVEVLGYGGGSGEEDEEDEETKKKKRKSGAP